MTQYSSDDAHFSFEDSGFRIPGPPAQPLMAQWHGRNQAVTVAGLLIPSGMVYVGEHLPGKDGTSDPCLIDPLKAVDLRADYNQTHVCDDRPVYADMSPSARGAYLKWLADGRSGPDADISNIWLFFFGLERRVLLDCQADTTLFAELPIIAKELLRLLKHYGKTSSLFQRKCGELLEVVNLLQAPPQLYLQAVPELAVGTMMPMLLRLAIGQAVADQYPIPVQLALAWVRHDPVIVLSPAAAYCTEQFHALFLAKYVARHGDRIRIRPTAARLKCVYAPASGVSRDTQGIDVELGDIPDIDAIDGPVNFLQKVVDECAAALEMQNATAILALELLIMQAQINQVFSDEKLVVLDEEIARWTHLGTQQQRELMAHARLLLQEPMPSSTMRRKVDAAGQAVREACAEFIVGIAGSDAHLPRGEVAVLERLYGFLDVERKKLYLALHGMETAPATKHATVSDAAASGVVMLDLARIAQLQSDSEKLAVLLGNIFVDDAVPVPVATASPISSSLDRLAGLDSAHTVFMRQLLARPSWSRSELEVLARSLDMMLDGALEHVNEACLDAYDCLCSEGDDPIDINPDIHERIAP